ncbi:flagellar hook-basal body complex protein FliE [Thiohalospira halophila DSM 15071]|uniref:Flagellar hook-basal body complex protein FliE n=1 Tax=Thiohalospira halophila DSM 15071 TaxID=1123397 RepID=A0A1I1PMP9_9GAMM|nr:flagellar hook-basal body complex protein FliE [Thiohalospira halophila]SFD08928.1 flagellar hook-basal body complex protein FliE [Thiohalospira halophila DSM 15071]
MNNIDPSSMMAEMQRLSAQAQGGVDRPEAPAVSGHGEGPGAAQGSEEAEAPSFTELLKQSIDQVDELQKASGDVKEAFQAGDPNTSLGDVMIAGEKAGLAFQTLSEARSKLLEAYRSIQNMSV